MLKMHLSSCGLERVKYEWQPTVKSHTDRNTHSCTWKQQAGTLFRLAVAEHLGQREVIDKFDVTAPLHKLHKDRTWRTSLLVAASCQALWNKVGHICMHFALLLHLLTQKLSRVKFQGTKYHNTFSAFKHNIILYLILWCNRVCIRPEHIHKNFHSEFSPHSLKLPPLLSFLLISWCPWFREKPRLWRLRWTDQLLCSRCGRLLGFWSPCPCPNTDLNDRQIRRKRREEILVQVYKHHQLINFGKCNTYAKKINKKSAKEANMPKMTYKIFSNWTTFKCQIA